MIPNRTSPRPGTRGSLHSSTLPVSHRPILPPTARSVLWISEEIGCHSKNSKVKQRIFMNLPKISIDYHKIVYCGAENCIVSNIFQEIFETHPFHTSTQHSTRSKPFQGTNSGSKVEPSWPLKSCKSFTWSSNVWCHGVHFGSSSNCKSCNYFDLKARFYEKRSNDIQKESSWE